MASNQFSWQSNDGPIPLLFEVQTEFNPASGLSPTVEVKRASDEFYADWTTITFKPPAASGDKFGSMSVVDNSPGVYKRFFNPVDFSQTLPQQTFIVTYRVTLPSGFIVDESCPPLSKARNLTQTETHLFTDMVGSGVQFLQGMTAEFC